MLILGAAVAIVKEDCALLAHLKGVRHRYLSEYFVDLFRKYRYRQFL